MFFVVCPYFGSREEFNCFSNHFSTAGPVELKLVIMYLGWALDGGPDGQKVFDQRAPVLFS